MKKSVAVLVFFLLATAVLSGCVDKPADECEGGADALPLKNPDSNRAKASAQETLLAQANNPALL